MPGYTGTTAATFPQTSNNRSLDGMVSELAQYSGGEDRADVQDKARASILAAIREFNQVYWAFNLVTQDHTLVAGTANYTLNSQFARQHRAQMVDSNSKTSEEVEWIPWELWASKYPDQSSTGSMPLYYTARNLHETGQITIDPVPAATLTYPTLRIFYFRWIDSPSSGSDKIECPSVVEAAIFDTAIYKFLSKVKGFRESRDAMGSALLSRAAVEREYRAFEDYYGA